MHSSLLARSEIKKTKINKKEEIFTTDLARDLVCNNEFSTEINPFYSAVMLFLRTYTHTVCMTARKRNAFKMEMKMCSFNSFLVDNEIETEMTIEWKCSVVVPFIV